MIQEFVRDHSFNVFEPSEETVFLTISTYKNQLLKYGNFEDLKKKIKH